MLVGAFGDSGQADLLEFVECDKNDNDDHTSNSTSNDIDPLRDNCINECPSVILKLCDSL